MKIFEKKWYLEEQVIKPSQNVFDVLFQTATRSFYLNNVTLINNYSQKYI